MKKTIAIGIVVFLACLVLIPSVSATWCNNDYGKKAPILINNTAGSAQTYYQVELNYTYDSDMNVNFNDTRVYNESDCSLIPLWNESAVASSWNKIWVNYSNIPASSWTNTTYYLYYNYSSASSASNETNTYKFFEDFDGGVDRTEVDPNSHIVQDRTTDKRLEWTLLNRAEDAYVYADMGANYFKDFEVRLKVSPTGGSGDGVVTFIAFSNDIDDQKGWIDNTKPFISGYLYSSSYTSVRCYETSVENIDIHTTGSLNDVRYMKITRENNEVKMYYYDDAAFSNQIALGTIAQSVSTQYRYIFLVNTYNDAQAARTHTGYSDRYRVRKYNSSDPTAQLGAEESPSATYTPPNPTNLQNTTGNFWVNYTWDNGTGNVTNLYHVNWNETWYNNTVNTYMNKSVGASNWANITVFAWNSSGNGTLSVGSVSDQVQAPSEPPCTTPVISSLTNTTAGSHNVTITWSTNQSADNRVKYSKNSDLSSHSWSSWDNDTTLVSISLTDLDAETPYYYQAWSYNGTNSTCYVTEPTSSPYKTFITASGAWCNNNYGKKVPIHINNTGGGALTYYEVELNITNSEQVSDMENDFSDIGIYNESSCSLVPFFIIDKINGSWCDIWVNYSNIPASSWTNTTYYLYYNYSSASSASNETNTFKFYSEPNIPNYGTRETTNPVLEVASADGYDDEDAFFANVIEVDEVDGKYYMYYIGEHYAGGADDYTVALAMSDDGITWTKYTTVQPVLGKGSGEDFDATHLFAPVVVKDGATWHMWYGGYNGTRGGIGHATSTDGKNWTKDANNPVLDCVEGTWEDIESHPGTVIKDGSTWKMWYHGKDSSGRGKLGYATASNPNGANWTKHGSNPIFSRTSTDNWDAQSIGGDPFVLKIADNDWRMFFPGQTSGSGGTQEIGLAKSTDGISWTEIDDNPIYYGSADGGDDSEIGVWWENAGTGYSFSVLKVGDEYWAWYSSHTDHGVNAGYPDTCQIGLLKNVQIDQPLGFSPKWIKNRGLGGGGIPSHSQCLDFNNTNKKIVGAYRRSTDTDFLKDGTDIGTQHQAIYTLPSSFIVEWKSKIHNTGVDKMGQGGIAVVADDDTIILFGGHMDGGGPDAYFTRTFIVENAWADRWTEEKSNDDQCTFKIVRDGTSLKGYVDGVLKKEITTASTVSKIALAGGGYGGYAYVDYIQIEDVRVRKYASLEPTAQLGAEKDAPTGATYTPPNPTNLQNTTGNFWVNYTWDADSGNVTNGYNVTWNSSWYNTSNEYMNKSVGASNWANITVWAWNSSGSGTMSVGNVSDQIKMSALDTTFTVTLPIGYTYAHFQPPNSTAKNYSCNGQNLTTAFYNVTNTGNVNLDVRMKLNATITNIILRADTDNNPSGSSIIQTTLVTIYSSLTQSNSIDIWIWSDFNHTTQQTTNKTLSINVTE